MIKIMLDRKGVIDVKEKNISPPPKKQKKHILKTYFPPLPFLRPHRSFGN